MNIILFYQWCAMGMLQKYFGVKKYQHFPTPPVFTQGLQILLEETRKIIA